tara:strand:+ start:512 stop:667 length:156 start_codon:yes stop_codon:yes gene_type:complete
MVDALKALVPNTAPVSSEAKLGTRMHFFLGLQMVLISSAHFQDLWAIVGLI